MSKYITKLIGNEEIANGTMAFHFEKPNGFTFKAGQNIDMLVIDPPETDAEGNKRTFSLASSPNENRLTVATRMRDTAFKRVLKTMEPGSNIQIDGPYGDIYLHNNVTRPAVLLSGGIGITLFRSIIIDATERNLPQQIILFYSNRRSEDAAYLEELKNIKNPNYTFVGTITSMDKSHEPWSGETGYIDKEMLAKYIPDMSLPIYYIAGPPTMVTALNDMLLNANVDSDNIRIEEFAGY